MVYVIAIIIGVSTVIYTAIGLHYGRRRIVMPKKIPILFPLISGVLIIIIYICARGISSAPVAILALSPIVGIYVAVTYSWYSFWRKTSLRKGYLNLYDDDDTVEVDAEAAREDIAAKSLTMGEQSFLLRGCVAFLIGLGFLMCMVGLGLAATSIFHLSESAFPAFLITGLIGIPVIWLSLLVFWEARRKKRSRGQEVELQQL